MIGRHTHTWIVYGKNSKDWYHLRSSLRKRSIFSSLHCLLSLSISHSDILAFPFPLLSAYSYTHLSLNFFLSLFTNLISLSCNAHLSSLFS
jgi:hypothetical protein